MYVESVRKTVMAPSMQQTAQTDSEKATAAVQPRDGEARPAAANNITYVKDASAKNTYNEMAGSKADKQVKNTDNEELFVAENEKIKKQIERMNAQLSNSEAKFGIHEATNRVMIKIVDKSTQEVIKEIPPEKTLDMIAKCMEMAGILIDEKL